MRRDPATERQVDAADPHKSTWLSANAGSGKTRVLTDRVARLLLDGTDPRNILCLTYTKAAASEMQNRLFERLGAWAMEPDEALRGKLAELGAEGPFDQTTLRNARTLFASAVETPGGLRIQTIHSFCSSILRRFPLEAGVSPQFRELDERSAEVLQAKVLDEMSVETPELVSALLRHGDGNGFDNLLPAILSARPKLRVPVDEAELCAVLDIPLELTSEALLAEVLGNDWSDVIEATIAACNVGTDTDKAAAVELAEFPVRPSLNDLIILEGRFLTKSGKTPFTAKIDKFPGKDARNSNPDLNPALNDLMERVEAGRDRRLALMTKIKTLALHRFATAFLARYEATKLAHGALDFDDLIANAHSLLTNPAVAQWVLFRLDGGIDHILVDEAQDTSPLQWAVVHGLAQEFSAGEGARPDRQRTLFVVGDKKQSIYSFQGADPEGFDQSYQHFETELGNIGQTVRATELAYSFRSASAILNTVDAVFRHANSEGVGTSQHYAFKENMPGRVDLWPTLLDDKEETEERDWRDPPDTPGRTDARARLASTIAQEIKRMLSEDHLPVTHKDGTQTRRKIRPGDIMILLQSRSGLFSPIIAECKAAGLDVAGSDRLKIQGELAVQDIASLLRFLALPEDDLSLAEALKSPLFGWSEQELFTLAHHRPEGSYLWQALRDANETYPETMAILDDLMGQTDLMRPYDLINRILVRHDGRRKLLGRLGPEAEDGVDALLTQALNYEKAQIPGLTGFLDWMQTDNLEIKRQMSAAEDKIRVMTVHGAKGLEAPIVILPDTAARKPNEKNPTLVSGGTVLWSSSMASSSAALADLRENRADRNLRERRRLLYVAMTRAENWLIVCAAGDTGKDGTSWHDMIAAGMEHVGAAARGTPTGDGLRFASGNWDGGEIDAPSPALDTPDTLSLAFDPLQPHGRDMQPLSPSDLEGAKAMPGEALPEDEQDALARGRLMHLLLEVLPGVPPEDRLNLGHKIITGHEDAVLLDQPELLVEDATRLTQATHLSAVFDPATLAEVELSATIDGLGPVQGIVDRLHVTPERVWIIDYKTNRLVPYRPEDIPLGVLRQMAAYDAMARAIWPEREVRVSILWTAEAQLMDVPPFLLAATLADVMSERADLDAAQVHP